VPVVFLTQSVTTCLFQYS